jgi:hypothetical protein
LTRIAIHILVKKGELLIWRNNGHFPHCAMIRNKNDILQKLLIFNDLHQTWAFAIGVNTNLFISVY